MNLAGEDGYNREHENKDFIIEMGGPDVAAAKLIDFLPLLVPGLDYYGGNLQKFGLVV